MVDFMGFNRVIIMGYNPIILYWLVVNGCHQFGIFPEILGISSSQLTLFFPEILGC